LTSTVWIPAWVGKNHQFEFRLVRIGFKSRLIKTKTRTKIPFQKILGTGTGRGFRDE